MKLYNVITQVDAGDAGQLFVCFDIEATRDVSEDGFTYPEHREVTKIHWVELALAGKLGIPITKKIIEDRQATEIIERLVLDAIEFESITELKQTA